MLRKIVNSKVAKNFSYLTIGSLLTQLLSVITIFKISRIFSPEDYGLYTFIFAQAQLLNTVGDLGLRNIHIRAIARDPARTKDLMYNGVKLRVLSSVFLMATYVVYNYFLGSLSYRELVILFLFALVGIISNLFENAFFGWQKMKTPAIVNLAFNASWAFMIFFLPANYFSVNLLLELTVVSGALKSALMYWLMTKEDIISGKTDGFIASSKTVLRESWPYLSLTLLQVPVTQMANTFLDINTNKAEIGYFNLSQKLIGPVTIVIGYALAAVFPNLSSMWAKDSSRFYQVVAKGFSVMFLLSAMLCFLFTLFARDVITLFFTDSYLPAVKVCQLQVWYVFLMGINSFIGTVWGAENKEKLILQTAIVNLVVSAPLLYIGSMYGALGLSYGYVGSFALFEFYLWYTFQKDNTIKVPNSAIFWIVGVLLFFLAYFMPTSVKIVYRIAIAVAAVIATGLYVKKNIRAYES